MRYTFDEMQFMLSTGRTWHRHFLWEPIRIEGELHWLRTVWRRRVQGDPCPCCGQPDPMYEYMTQERLDELAEKGLDPD